MTMDKKIQEEEYQFPNEEQYSPGTSQEQDETADEDSSSSAVEHQGNLKTAMMSKLSFLSVRRNQVLILGVIVVFIVFNFMQPKKDKVKVVAHKPVAQKIAPAKQPELAKLTLPVVQDNYASSSQITSLDQQLTESNQKVDDQSDQISELHDALANVNNNQQRLLTTIANMQQALSLMNKKLVDMTKKKVKVAPVVKPVTYNVKSIIPGRVWLRGSNGSSQTATIGTHISNYYGRVVSIDPSSGEVVTTSHKLIHYGHNDY